MRKPIGFNKEVLDMNLIRWNSGSDLLNLHSELDRLFEELS